MSRAVRFSILVVSTGLGIALLVWQIQKAGSAAVVEGLAAVGWGFSAILILSGLRFAARSLAWVTLMGGDVPWSSACAAYISGDAIGNLTPLRLVASEPAKALLLGPGVDASRALAALVVENVYYSVSVAVVILLGAAAMLAAFDVGEAVRWAGWIAIGAMVATLTVLAGVVWFKPAMASAVVRRLPLVRAAAIGARVRAFEETTYDLVDRHRGRLATIVAAETAFHVFSFGETYVTLWLLTGVSSPLAAFVLDTVNRVINLVFVMVPLRVGVAETGTGLIANAIGLTRSSGVSLALVAKGRILAWAAVGLVLAGSRTATRRAHTKA